MWEHENTQIAYWSLLESKILAPYRLIGSTLILDKVTTEDAGRYTCEAFNEAEGTRATVEIQLHLQESRGWSTNFGVMLQSSFSALLLVTLQHLILQLVWIWWDNCYVSFWLVRILYLIIILFHVTYVTFQFWELGLCKPLYMLQNRKIQSVICICTSLCCCWCDLWW